jgi:hypothetical protein
MYRVNTENLLVMKTLISMGLKVRRGGWIMLSESLGIGVSLNPKSAKS